MLYIAIEIQHEKIMHEAAIYSPTRDALHN